MREHESSKNQQSLISMRQMVLEISHSKVLASISLKCDVTDVILQDSEKIKMQYLSNLSLD